MKKLVASLLVASWHLVLRLVADHLIPQQVQASPQEPLLLAQRLQQLAEATTTNAETNVLNINLASEPDYLDPAPNSSVDGGCLAVNSFAGLYTYVIRMVILSRHSQPICRKYLRTELSTPFT